MNAKLVRLAMQEVHTSLLPCRPVWLSRVLTQKDHTTRTASPQLSGNAMLNIECLRRALVLDRKKMGRMKEKLYIQVDNASDNKCRWMFGFAAYLIKGACCRTLTRTCMTISPPHHLLTSTPHPLLSNPHYACCTGLLYLPLITASSLRDYSLIVPSLFPHHPTPHYPLTTLTTPSLPPHYPLITGGYVRQVEIVMLMVGHTHEDIDAAFRIIADEIERRQVRTTRVCARDGAFTHESAPNHSHNTSA